MPYPFRVEAKIAPDATGNSGTRREHQQQEKLRAAPDAQPYFRDALTAETRATRMFEAGAHSVSVFYLGHRVATFSPADWRAVVRGVRATFLLARIEAGVAALGPDIVPRPRGKNQRAVLELIEQYSRDVLVGVALPDDLHDRLRPYLK